MNKKKVIKFSTWALNFLIIFALMWSIINYKILDQEVTRVVITGGLIAMVFFVIIFEGAPVFIGPSVAVAAILTMNIFNPWFVFLLFILSAIIGNLVYFYLGYFSGEKVMRYFDKEKVEQYRKLFKKYGRRSMLIMAISPIPYFPTLAGVFKMSQRRFFLETLPVRLLRHTFVFLFWFAVLVGF